MADDFKLRQRLEERAARQTALDRAILALEDIASGVNPQGAAAIAEIALAEVKAKQSEEDCR